jgi:molybdopterin-guanine dinucleotide biosynthesis protein B
MLNNAHLPIVGFAAFSGTGKTTLLKELLPLLSACASRSRWALVVERTRDREPRLDEVLLELDQAALDLILVEGFKDEQFAKIELHRPSLRRPLLFPDDDAIIAVATDTPLDDTCRLPQLDLNRPEEIAAFIFDYVAKEIPVLQAANGTLDSDP